MNSELEKKFLDQIDLINQSRKYKISVRAYDPKSPFDGTTTLHSVVRRAVENEIAIWDQYDQQVCMYFLHHDDKNIKLEELIDGFFKEAKEKDYNLERAKPLCHVSYPTTLYIPLFINDMPMRLISSWSISYNAYCTSLDTIIATKTWHDEKPLL